MEGVTVIRVVRQIRVVRFANINEQPDAASPLVRPEQLTLPPPPKMNNRCLNAFVLLIIYTVGIGSIVLGANHLNDCPAEKMLPTSLVIFGGMLMVSRLLNCVYDCRSVCEEESCENVPPCLTLLNLIFLLAEFGMFIALCYYAFNIQPSTNPEDVHIANYCDYTLYKTSFYGCIVGIIFYALPIFCVCCVAGCCSS